MGRRRESFLDAVTEGLNGGQITPSSLNLVWPDATGRWDGSEEGRRTLSSPDVPSLF